ncbi:DUF4554 domain-containing protein isoform X2 [Nerophis ophidion]|uniref:DUF4554 domain-containing protein isoform X2 n=1 Tax=Nerophis ophidion TaxID=159077 RepID=UPI002AE07F49|nr:DUF4554 domain-containing protein isoform X2 [Nerophis ophidion]
MRGTPAATNMQQLIKQALRLFLLLGKQSQSHGGILVLLWTESGAANCTVAAAGPKWKGVGKEALQSVLTDLKFLSSVPFADPDPEELCAFTELHGSLRLLLSFQVKDARFFTPDWLCGLQAFLHTFSQANAQTTVHLRCTVPQMNMQQLFRATFTRKVKVGEKLSLTLDVTCSVDKQMKEVWCHGGHPVLGSVLALGIPPEAMERGLCGQLSMRVVTLLSPCLLQYPNLQARLTHLHVLAYSPANLPITLPLAFLQDLPARPDCQEVGLRGPSYAGPSYHSGVVYTVEQEPGQEQQNKFHSVEQKLSVFLFLQHTDPFASTVSDFMVSEVLMERHLDHILSNNSRALTTALKEELTNTLKAQRGRKQDQEKMLMATEVLLSSTISIVTCSTNQDFRRDCMSRMQVCDTQQLWASLREALLRVTSWRCVPRRRCQSAAQVEEHLESEEAM